MLVWLPWIAIVLILALIASPSSHERQPRRSPDWLGLPVLLVLSVAALAASHFGVPAIDETGRGLFGLAIGLLAAGACHAIESTKGSSGPIGAAPIALAAAILGWMKTPVPMESVAGWLGIIAGASIGTIWMRATRTDIENRLGYSLSLSCAGLGLASCLGALGPGFRAANFALVIGLAAACLYVVFGAVADRPKLQLGGTVGYLLGLLAALLVATPAYFRIPEMAQPLAMGVICAAVAAWMMPRDRAATGTQTALAAVLWLGVSTVAFTSLKGYGLAIALASASLAGLWFPSRLVTSSLGPFLALAFYRVLKELKPTMAVNFDIGQHYALIGILAGVLLILAPTDYLTTRDSRDATRGGLASAFAGALVLVAAAGAMILLGLRGSVGLLVGLGFAPIVLAFRGTNLGVAMPAGIGMSALVVLAAKPLEVAMGLGRDDRLKLLITVAVVCAILAVLSGLVGGGARKNAAAREVLA